MAGNGIVPRAPLKGRRSDGLGVLAAEAGGSAAILVSPAGDFGSGDLAADPSMPMGGFNTIRPAAGGPLGDGAAAILAASACRTASWRLASLARCAISLATSSFRSPASLARRCTLAVASAVAVVSSNCNFAFSCSLASRARCLSINPAAAKAIFCCCSCICVRTP